MTEHHRGIAPVTLVLTIFDAAGYLPDVLTSIGRQEILPAELLITDRGSHDQSVTILNAWQPPAGVAVSVIVAPGASIAEGRNLAIEAASFDHIAVTHGAVCLQREWLAALWTALADGSDVVRGQILPVGSNLMERVIGRLVTPLPADPGLPSSSSMAFRKSTWERVGGYPEWLRYGQDEAFDRALQAEGISVRYVAGSRASWNPQLTLPGYVLACFRTARSQGRADVSTGGLGALFLCYLSGAIGLAIFRRSPVLRFAEAATMIVHVAPYWRRVWHTRQGSPDNVVVRWAATAVGVLVGDAAKMSGLLIGHWRRLWADPSRVRLGQLGSSRGRLAVVADENLVGELS